MSSSRSAGEVVWTARLRELPEVAMEVLGPAARRYHRHDGTLVLARGDRRLVASVEGLAGADYAREPAADVAGHLLRCLRETWRIGRPVTLGSSSALAYLASPGHKEHRRPFAERTREAFHQAYHGGLVAAVVPGRHESVVRYDLRRAYRWAMEGRMPLGAGVRRLAGWHGMEAIYHTEAGWMWGYDVAALGVKSWREAVTWRDWVPAHDGFLERSDSLESAHGKILVNALYGQHGVKGTTERVPIDDCRGEGWVWDDDLVWAYRERPAPHRPWHAPHWAGLITARVRDRVRQGIETGRAVLCYVDMVLARAPLPEGTSPGDWRREEDYLWVYVMGGGHWVGRRQDGGMDYSLPGIRLREQVAWWREWCRSNRLRPEDGLPYDLPQFPRLATP